MNREQFESLLAGLESELEQIKQIDQSVVDFAEQSILVCRRWLEKLKEAVVENGFASDEDEIEFFKFQKPKITAKLFYFAYLLKLETGIGFYDTQSLIRYYKRRQKGLAAYSRKNETFIFYYRSGSTSLDDKFFKRNSTDLKLFRNPIVFQFDPAFSTTHDHKVAILLAKEELAKYISDRIEELVNPDSQAEFKTNFHWTDSKVALVELIYGLEAAKSINSGKVDIIALVKFFEKAFNFELKESYHTFTNIKNRKMGQTKYLDHMRDALIRRINEDLE